MKLVFNKKHNVKLVYIVFFFYSTFCSAQTSKLIVYYDTTNLNMHLDFCKKMKYNFANPAKDSLLRTTEKYIDSMHLYSKPKISLLYYTHAKINNLYTRYRYGLGENLTSSILNDLQLALQYDSTNVFCIKREIASLTKSSADYTAIKKLGYKSAYSAFGGHLSVIQAFTTTLAFDVSFSMFAPRYKVYLPNSKKKCSECSQRFAFSASAPSVGYEWNVTNGNRGFRVSMFEINSLIHIVPLQFVFLKSTNGMRTGILRPEIGFGWGKFSLSYAYNMYLGKNFDRTEKSLITLKFDFAIDKWNETEF